MPGKTYLSHFPLLLVPALIAGALLTGFWYPEPSSHVNGPGKPASDFKFLKRYICISDLFGKEQWTENKGRSFDKDGVHLTNGKTHPVNSCHYALFCYDEYKSTGDTAYLNAFYAQVKYLMKPEYYHEIDTDKVAYPYLIAFHDLKSPWYSALAQSEAICTLVRYYALTRDEKALTLIVKLRNFMVHPQESNCGTMSITPEGKRWYEEYPNSKQEKQVLNGFFLAIVALYEYSNLFPDDDSARFQYEESIQTVKALYKFFDTGSWLKYNRGDGRQVSNGYMKWQVLETKFLYELTGDIYFKNLSMLISTYCYNKPFDTPGSKLRDYDFSVPLDTGFGDILAFKGKTSRIELNKSNGSMSSSFGGADAEMSKVYDTFAATFAKLNVPEQNRKSDNYITWNFKQSQWIGSCSITFMSGDSMEIPEVTLMYKDTVKSKQWQKLQSLEKVVGKKSVEFRFKKINATSITFSFKDLSSQKEIRVADISCFLPAEIVQSDYRHYTTMPVVSDAATVAMTLDYTEMKEVAVFSKKADNEKQLDQEKWDPLNVQRGREFKFPSKKGQYHRFLIICEPKSEKAVLKRPTLK